jgi:hypothetical protein
MDLRKISIIDFGLASMYKEGKKHIKFVENQPLKGSILFCSINALKGNKLSRRDDLENLCYTLAFLENGTVPWVLSKASPEVGYFRIFQIEQTRLRMKDE